MQEIEMPEKCCFYPLEEELGRGGALIKQKFNYLLSIRNFRRRKVHRHGQAAAGETHNDYFCAKIHTKYTLKVFDLKWPGMNFAQSIIYSGKMILAASENTFHNGC